MSRSKTPPSQLDKAFVADIDQAAVLMESWLVNVTKDQFVANAMLQSAVIRQIGIIGEAANKLSNTFKAAHKSIPWKQIVGMRNVVLHNYWNVDLDIVWDAATVKAPALASYLRDNA